MKIAFYIPNSNIKHVDLSEVQNANPGIGGTEYAMLALVYYLSLNCSNELTIYSNAPLCNYKGSVSNFIESSLDSVLKSSVQKQMDVLIVHHSEHSMAKNAFDALKGSNVSLVLWIHNFLNPRILSFYGDNPQIKRIVFVGREFLNCYRDHPAFQKSTFIYNGIKIPFVNKISYSKRPNYVTYIGNLIPGKGFHILAKSWKKILKKVPDAELHVIGSGKLYDRNAKMGKYGLAQDDYEKEFIQHLVDDSGNIIDSVIFHGIMGKEKNDVVQMTKVGVPNPSGYSETFGYTAIEMELFDCLIATIRCPGYIDTVSSDGILYKNPSKLADAVISLLQKTENTEQSSFLEKFDFSVISPKWEQLLSDVYLNKPNIIEPYKGQGVLSIIREGLRIMKLKYSFFKCVPTIEGIRFSFNRNKNRIKTKLKHAKSSIYN